MRGILALDGSYVIEFIKGTVDVVVYGDVDISFGVVTFQVKYTVKGAGPVNCALLVGLD